MMYYVFRPHSDNKLFAWYGNSKYLPIPLPLTTKNKNIMKDNLDREKVGGVSESNLFNKTAYN